MREEHAGGINLDISIDEFNEKGFTFGDSVDIAFSNGFELKDIPYYSGYYTDAGGKLVVGYPSYTYVRIAINYGESLWEEAGLQKGDTATVSLAEAAKYLDRQEALDVAYTDERSDYESDERFANFRALTGGSIAQDVAYRSASPINSYHNRAAFVEELMEQAGVAFVLDLADSAESAAEYIADSKDHGVDLSYFDNLLDAGCVAYLDMTVSYPSEENARKLAAGLIEMSTHGGPYLIHCLEGKDRTGFVCLLLEALCGASYDEMVADYMTTYDNYYGITRESEPSKYDAIVDLHPNGMLRFLAGADKEADLTSIEYAQPARDYLKAAGMTDEQIDTLVDRLTSQDSRQ